MHMHIGIQDVIMFVLIAASVTVGCQARRVHNRNRAAAARKPL